MQLIHQYVESHDKFLLLRQASINDRARALTMALKLLAFIMKIELSSCVVENNGFVKRIAKSCSHFDLHFLFCALISSVRHPIRTDYKRITPLSPPPPPLLPTSSSSSHQRNDARVNQTMPSKSCYLFCCRFTLNASHYLYGLCRRFLPEKRHQMSATTIHRYHTSDSIIDKER